jgi:hypothetical protein
MIYLRYKHIDGRYRVLSCGSASDLDNAAHVVPGTVAEIAAPPTPSQMLDASGQIVDVPRRRARDLAGLISDIGALTSADRTKLFAAVAAKILQEHPKLARSLSIALDGDEVA